jgi:hypothetical protein
LSAQGVKVGHGQAAVFSQGHGLRFGHLSGHIFHHALLFFAIKTQRLLLLVSLKLIESTPTGWLSLSATSSFGIFSIGEHNRHLRGFEKLSI